MTSYFCVYMNINELCKSTKLNVNSSAKYTFPGNILDLQAGFSMTYC